MSAFDGQISVWLNEFVSRWPLLELFLRWLQGSNLVKFLPFVLVICWLWFVQNPRQRLNRQLLLMTVLTAFTAIFSARFLALMLPFRERPFENPDLHFHLSFEPELRTWSSFPSDHAVMAFAIAASFFRLSPNIGLWAFFHAAVFISLPRLCLGLHYPSDVLAGALIGITLALTISRLPRLDAVTGAFLDIERKFPAPFYAIGFLTLFEIAEMFYPVRALVAGVFQVLRQILS